MNDALARYRERLAHAAGEVQRRAGTEVPAAAIVLGSGLGVLAEQVEGATILPYGEIPGMPTSGVEGHAGKLVAGWLEGQRVLVFSGRVHYYEGWDLPDIVFGVRLARLLGASRLVLTNAAGALHSDLDPGDLMLIRDHIHLLFGLNPLRGPNLDEFGPRFPDMTHVYPLRLRKLFVRAARELAGEGIVDVPLKSGVYASLPGPSYETPAEVRLLRHLGADAVGMSTTAEAIAARHAGMEVAGVSCISNRAAGLADGTLSHEEVKETAARASQAFVALLCRFVRLLGDRGAEEASP